MAKKSVRVPKRIINNCLGCPHRNRQCVTHGTCNLMKNGIAIYCSDPIPDWCPLEDVGGEFDEVLKDIPDDRKDVVRQILENQAESLKKLQLKVDEPPSMSWTIERLRTQLKEKDEKIDLLEEKLGELEEITNAVTCKHDEIKSQNDACNDSIKRIIGINKKLKKLREPEELESSRKLDLG